MSRLQRALLGAVLASSLGASYPPLNDPLSRKRPAPPIKRKLTKAEKKALKRAKVRPPKT